MMYNLPIYIIGDIHGEYQKLVDLLEEIRLHKIRKNVGFPVLCFVGDYVDRGPDSKGVLDLVKSMQEAEPIDFYQVVALKGNHEDMMVRSQTSKYYEDMWLYNGGLQTVGSFITSPRNGMKVKDILGEDLFEWCKNLPEYYEIGNICVAHAGIDMREHPASIHTSEQLLWSRGLRMDAHNIYKYTVHGHTPMKRPIVDEHVAYIDTGAVFGRKLTCLFIPDTIYPNKDDMEIIDVR